MLNPYREINWRPQRDDLRQFAAVVGWGFLLLGLAAALGLVFSAAPAWRNLSRIGFAGGIMFMTLRLVPRLLLPVYYLWFAVGGALGLVVGNLLLTVFYYGLLTPYGLAARTIGRRKFFRSGWRRYQPEQDLQRYFRPY